MRPKYRLMPAQIRIDNLPTPRDLNQVNGEKSVAINVMDFGAVPDGETDNTDGKSIRCQIHQGPMLLSRFTFLFCFLIAFQQALDAAGAKDGSHIVFAPAGKYKFSGSLKFPPTVALIGTYQKAPSHQFPKGAPSDGTVLMPTANEGNADAPGFLHIQTDGTLRGVCIYYPRQTGEKKVIEYPFAISLSGNDAAVIDVELLNAYQGVKAVGAARHYLARIEGQPIHTGVYLDQIYDIGRLEDVHFNP